MGIKRSDRYTLTERYPSKPEGGDVMPLILPLVFTATFFSILNSSMVNVALPTIMRQFGVDFQYSVWLYTGYMLPYAVAMPISGSLGDMYGAKKVFLAGIAVFAVGSLLCSTADGFWSLLAFRAVQALGAAAVMPNAMVLVTSPFPAERRGVILGWWGMIASAGSLVGPTLGGFLTEHIGWSSIFYVNLPFAVAVLVLGALFVPRSGAPAGRHGFDVAGAVYMTVSLVSLLLAISLLRSESWHTPRLLALEGAFAVSFILLLRQERRVAVPLIYLPLFGVTAFSATIAVSFLQSMAMFGGLLLIPLYLQHVHNFSPTYAGFLMLPLSITMMLLSPLVGRLTTKRDARQLAVWGMLTIMVGLWLFSRLTLTSPYWVLAAALVATGAGLGVSSTPLSANLVNLVEQEKMGMASGVFNMTRFVGGVIGSTIFGAFMQYRLEIRLQQLAAGGQDGAVPPALLEKVAMTGAFHDVYLLALATTGLGLALSWFINPPPRRAPSPMRQPG